MQIDEEASRRAVGAANDAFYKAFEALDLRAMDLVWADRSYAAVVHPGREVIRDWSEVRRSWSEIFEGTDKIRFRLTDRHLEVRGRMAFVTAREHIRHGDDVLVSLQATNIFELIDGRWRMILHHSSPISDDAGDPDTEFIQ